MTLRQVKRDEYRWNGPWGRFLWLELTSFENYEIRHVEASNIIFLKNHLLSLTRGKLATGNNYGIDTNPGSAEKRVPF
ncbi:MAG: hypothetical protein ACJ8MO_16675 [Bacillus sp. (in: firmicutes)]